MVLVVSAHMFNLASNTAFTLECVAEDDGDDSPFTVPVQSGDTTWFVHPGVMHTRPLAELRALDTPRVDMTEIMTTLFRFLRQD